MIKTKIVVYDITGEIALTENPIIDFEDFNQVDWKIDNEFNVRRICIGEKVKIKNTEYIIKSVFCTIEDAYKRMPINTPELSMQIYLDKS